MLRGDATQLFPSAQGRTSALGEANQLARANGESLAAKELCGEMLNEGRCRIAGSSRVCRNGPHGVFSVLAVELSYRYNKRLATTVAPRMF